MIISSFVILLSQFWTSQLYLLVITVASWSAYRFLRGQVRWSGIPISLGIFHSLLWSTVKDFSVVNETEVDVYPELSCISIIQQILAIWFLVLPFLNQSYTSGSSWFMYCWSLAQSILSITLLVCEMSTTVLLSILQHCPILWLEWKLTFSSPVATAELCKFTDILSAVL